jgi:predicted naringenin-chalcone synthase
MASGSVGVGPRIRAIGTATPECRFSQEEIFSLSGYTNDRIRAIFLNSDIDYRHFYFEGAPNRFEDSTQLNERFLKGAMRTGCQAIRNCLASANLTAEDVDLLVVCTSTGYVCPDIGSRLIGHIGFRRDVQRASVVGLGCAGAIPSLQRANDFVRAYPHRTALTLTVEICSACFYVDDTLETVVGNAICADGAAAVLLGTDTSHDGCLAEIVDFQSFLDPAQLDQVGFHHRQGKLRIVLSNDVRNLAAPMLQNALETMLQRNSLQRSDIRFWIAHPGGRKVLDNVQKHFALTDDQTRFSKHVLRNYGNMSSPTVLFVLDDVIQRGDPRPGDWGVMMALGPGMAAEVCLLKW